MVEAVLDRPPAHLAARGLAPALLPARPAHRTGRAARAAESRAGGFITSHSAAASTTNVIPLYGAMAKM